MNNTLLIVPLSDMSLHTEYLKGIHILGPE